jgi:hypothetical protein
MSTVPDTVPVASESCVREWQGRSAWGPVEST